MSFADLDGRLGARAAADQFSVEFVLDRDGTVWNHYKDGGNTGACGIARHYPADDLDVVMLSNAERGGLAVIREIDRRIRAS